MGNVHIEASQVNYRGGETKMSVEEALKNGTYELPIAGAETLGGVKVGSGLSINAETGVLSASGYELPIAGAEILGGVKVGSGLSINAETGVLSANSQKWDYSISEVNTGQKWIDGKDIFCKVYNNVQLTNNTEVVVDSSFGADKNIIDMKAIGKVSGEHTIYSNISNIQPGGDRAYPRYYDGVLSMMVNDDWSTWTCHIIVFYTKTTV